jgi:hypothetical protein
LKITIKKNALDIARLTTVFLVSFAITFAPQNIEKDDRAAAEIVFANSENTSYIEYSVPDVDSSFKAFMDYRSITDKTSDAYALQSKARTDALGFRRVGDDYIIALGSHFGKSIGTRYEIMLDSGKTFTAALGDNKSDRHTDKTNSYMEKTGNVVEFIIDRSVLSKEVYRLGDISSLGFEGSVVSIKEIM